MTEKNFCKDHGKHIELLSQINVDLAWIKSALKVLLVSIAIPCFLASLFFLGKMFVTPVFAKIFYE